MSKLAIAYNKACNDYVEALIKQFDLDEPDVYWVAEEVAGVLCVNDYYLNMDTIIIAVEKGVSFDKFVEWYDYTLAAKEFKFVSPNLKSYIAGCPVKSLEDITQLHLLKRQRLENMLQFDKLIEELVNKDGSGIPTEDF